MIIFLAAVLDVPQHLYESAELDGAGAFQRLRWVTLPTISPVILFSVVLGVIQALQYFTQAYVAASVAGGSASQAGTQSNLELGYPEGSTLFYPVLLYYQGFRFFNMGYASAMAIAAARRRVLGDAPDPAQLAPLGALPGSGAMSVGPRPTRGRAGSSGRSRPPRGAPPPAAGLDRRSQPAHRGGDHLPAAGRLHLPDLVDDERAGAVAEALARSVPVGQLHARCSAARRSGAGRSTRSSTPASRRSGCSSRASPSRMPSPGCAGAGATLLSSSCSWR